MILLKVCLVNDVVKCLSSKMNTKPKFLSLIEGNQKYIKTIKLKIKYKLIEFCILLNECLFKCHSLLLNLIMTPIIKLIMNLF